MRIVFITGEHDDQNLHDDLVARVSMRGRCVFNVEVRVAPGLGHETLSAESFARALDDLEKPAASTRRSSPTASTTGCNSA